MRIEEIQSTSSFFDQRRQNPYIRNPIQKRTKDGKSFKEVLEEMYAKVSESNN